MCISRSIAPSAIVSLILREEAMKQFDFTLGFGVMADNEIDARVKLADLLKAISKDEILKAMKLVRDEA
jgi:hypothetical protein